MRKISIAVTVFAVILLSFALLSCDVPSATISFCVDGKIVHKSEVSEDSGLAEYVPVLSDGVFGGWFVDPECTEPFSYHEYAVEGVFEDITVYALVLERTPDAVAVDEGCAHSAVFVSAIAPTCASAGNVGHWLCVLCDGTFADEACTEEVFPYLAPLGHDTDFVAAKAATCTESGIVSHYACKRCGRTFNDGDCTYEIDDVSVPKSGHVLEYCPHSDATCTSEGCLEHWSCSVCGNTFSDGYGLIGVSENELVLETLPHSYTVRIALYPDHDTAGMAELSCLCGAQSSEILPPLSDAAAYDVTVTAPTCTSEGSAVYIFAKDSWTANISLTLDRLEHSPAAAVDTKAPTCTQSGSTGDVYCSDCGALLAAAEDIPATGHNFELSTSTPSTCTQSGIREYSCTVCGETCDETLPLAEHRLVLCEEVPAGCTSYGTARHLECLDCGLVFDEDGNGIAADDLLLPPTGHVLGPSGACENCDYVELRGAIFERNDTGYTFVGLSSQYTEDELTIPAEYDGVAVTAIAEDFAFANCAGVSSLILPDSLLTIPSGALADLVALRSLTTPFVGVSREQPTSLAKMFDETAATNVYLTLESLTVTDATTIADSAFAFAVSLTSVTIEEGCEYVGQQAFASCSSLVFLALPSSVRTIGTNAFVRAFADGSPTISFGGSCEQWRVLSTDAGVSDKVSVECALGA